MNTILLAGNIYICSTNAWRNFKKFIANHNSEEESVSKTAQIFQGAALAADVINLMALGKSVLLDYEITVLQGNLADNPSQPRVESMIQNLLLEKEVLGTVSLQQQQIALIGSMTSQYCETTASHALTSPTTLLRGTAIALTAYQNK